MQQNSSILKLKKNTSRSSRTSSSNQTGFDIGRIPLNIDRMIYFQIIQLNDTKHNAENGSDSIIPKVKLHQQKEQYKNKIDYDEDFIINDEPHPRQANQLERYSDTDSLEGAETDHLCRSTEVYSSYLRVLPERFQDSPPQLCKLYYSELQGKNILTISECSSECFNDVMKVRLANRASFNEEELVGFVYDILLGLKYLEQQNNIRSFQDKDGKTEKNLSHPSELLYLSPQDISIFINSKKRKDQPTLEFKITNYIEKLIANQQCKKQYLIDQLISQDEQIFYFPPELLIQLFAPQNYYEQEKQINDDDQEFEQEEAWEETQIHHDQQEFLTCGFKGYIWSLGIILLRCFYSSYGDFLSHLYQPKNKFQYITDLLAHFKDGKIFSPVFQVEIEQNLDSKQIGPWLTGQMQQTVEFSWVFRKFIGDLLIFNVDQRPSVQELLEMSIFDSCKQNQTNVENQIVEPVSLGVFLNLIKLGLINQVTDKFFSDIELISMIKDSVFMDIELSGTNSRLVSFGALSSAVQLKVNQVCSEIRQPDSQTLNVEELITRLQRVSQIAPLRNKKEENEDSMSIKSEIVGQDKLNQQQIGRMGIFGRVGSSLFSSKSRKSGSPETLKSPDTQSTNEQTLTPAAVTPFTIKIAQFMLLKLLSSASDKNFKAFMGKFINLVDYEGALNQNVRKLCWSRALNLENEQAQRELIEFSLGVCGYYSMSKFQDCIQIEKDITRVHQYDWLANSYWGRLTLCKALKAFVYISEYNCYLQGMDCMMLVFLRAFGGDWQLSVLCLQELYRKRMIHSIEETLHQIKDEDEEDQLLRDSASQSEKVFKAAYTRKLQEKMLIYKWILVFLEPSLYQHLEKCGFTTDMYVVSWFTNFFSMDFELREVVKIWDNLLLAGELFEVFFAVSLMCEMKETLMLKDTNGIMNSIKNLTSTLNIQICLQYAQYLMGLLPKSLCMLNYADVNTHKELQKSQNEFIRERPWESSPLWKTINSKLCFQMTIFELLTLIRETRSHHPSYLMMIDIRTQKQYEESCITGSLFGHYSSGKITNAHLLKYLELKNQITSSIEQFKESQNTTPQSLFMKKNSPAFKPVEYIILIWDYNLQIQEVEQAVNYFLLVLQCRRLCVLKGGIQAVQLDGHETLKVKNKITLPIFIKKELDELKTI